MIFHQLEVRVRDRLGKFLDGAQARVALVWQDVMRPLDYDDATSSFAGDAIPPGLYNLRVDAVAGVSDEQTLQVDPAPTKLTVSLRKPTAWSSTPVPPAGDAYLIAVLPERSLAGKDATERVAAAAAAAGLIPVRGWDQTEKGTRRSLGLFALLPFAVEGEIEAQSRGGNAIAQLLAHEAVAAAGPFVAQAPDRGALWTQQVYVQLLPGTPLTEAARVAEELRLASMDRLPFGDDLYLAKLSAERSFEIDRILEALRSQPSVRAADPVPVGEIEALCCAESQGAAQGAVWDRCLVGVHEAQRLVGDGGVSQLVAIVDEDWRPLADLSSHPELEEDDRCAAGPRVLESIYFESNGSLGTDRVVEGESHALMCAAIVAGGISGVAPRSRLLLFVDPEDDSLHTKAWLWSGGLGDLPAAGLHALPAGADVFSASIARHYEITIAGTAALRRLVVEGRRGRGCPLFFAAGREGDIATLRSYASAPFTLAISASTCDGDGRESFATYSGWGDVDLCAPSGAGFTGYSGRAFDGVLAAAGPHWGKYPYREAALSQTTAEVLNPAGKYSAVVPVESGGSFLPMSYAMLVDGGGIWTSRRVQSTGVSQIMLSGGALGPFPPHSRVVSACRRLGALALGAESGTRTLTLEAPPDEPLTPGASIHVGEELGRPPKTYTVDQASERIVAVREDLSAHAVGESLFVDQSHWNLGFGTSTSAPLCAGTAALMLQANPRLTWVEVRQLLRDTAEKIDREPKDPPDPLGVWLGRDGRPNAVDPYFSRRYGFGRLAADRAVRAAIAYDFPRDLMVRQSTDDDGGPRRSPLGDSPDLWVRSTDPRALPIAERQDPGRHEPLRRSHESWAFARVFNRGREASLEAWVRFYVAAGQTAPYRFPDDFELTHADVLAPGRWQRGSRFLGEVHVDGIPAGGAQVVAVQWDPRLVPPVDDVDGRPWDPHLLVAVSPLDGPVDGVTMLDCNNLAQRAIAIVD